MKKHYLFLLLPVLLGCQSQSSSSINNEVFKTICPQGAPSLAFYPLAKNESFKTDSNTSNVSKELLGIDYDFVVFDSINGLKMTKKNQGNFKLSRIITGGNFYLVSYDKETGDIPSKDDTFVSFSESSLPDLVYKKLRSSYQKWASWELSDATYLNSTAEVSKALIAHQYDYYFIAEPSLSSALKQLGDNASKVQIVASLRNEWKTYSGQEAIPQAGLFVRDSFVQEHEIEYKYYVNLVNENKKNVIDHPSDVKASIDSLLSTTADQTAKFGINTDLLVKVQKDNQNKLGFMKDEEIGKVKDFVNTFINKLENPSYTQIEDQYFVI